MSSPLVRVKLANEPHGFRFAVAPPNRSMLLAGGSIGKLLSEWLGRYVAKPVVSGDLVEYFLRDENGRELAGIDAELATAADLKGSLRREFADLQRALQSAEPNATADQPLYDHVCRGLLDSASGQPGAFVKFGCQLFKYRDPAGRARLTWCYGFEPQVVRPDSIARICSEPSCRHMHMRHPGAEAKCPRCGRADAPPPAPRRGRRVARLAVLSLLVCAAVAAFLAWRSRETAVVSGRIVRAGGGAPIAAVVVHLEGSDRQVQSDERGEYRLERLPGGPARISAAAPGYATAAIDVELTRDHETPLEIPLAGAARLTGRVVHRVGGKDVAIAGAEVKLAGASESGDAVAAKSDETGKFELADLFPGDVQLAVAAAGFHATVARGAAAVADPSPIEIVLRGSERIAGQVVFANDAKLTVADAEVRVANEPETTVRSDAAGRFVLRDVPAGDVGLEVSGAGFQSKSVVARGGDALTVVALEGDATLAGQVLRADTKAPVGDAEVRLPGTPFVARTAADGKFRLAEVRSGPARINASAPGLAVVVTEELAAGKETSVTLLVAGTLAASGRVIDALDKKPVVGATVAVSELGLKATTGPDGTYTLTGLAQGTFRLVASTPNTFPSVLEFTPSVERPKLEDVELRVAAAVVGTVVSAKERQPLAGVTVAVEGLEASVMTAEDGRFRLFPLPPGDVVVTAGGDDYFPARKSAKLAAGEQSWDEIPLARLAAFRGVVRRALDQRPLAGATVVLKDTGEQVATGEDGSYKFSRAPAGVVTIDARAPGFAASSWRQTLAAGAQMLEDVALDGIVAVQGVTLDAFDKKKSVPGAKLEVVVGEYRATIEAKRNGGFEIGKLPADSLVEIVARAPGFLDAKISRRVTADEAWIEIPLSRLVEVAGTTVDAETRRPIPRVKLEASGPAGPQTLTTDKDGRFRLAGVPVGKLELTVAATRYAPETITVDVGSTAPDLTVPLKPLHKFEGSVVDATDSKKGIGDAQVTFSIGGYRGTATSGPFGAFTIELPKGRGTAEAAAAGFLNRQEEVEVGGARRTLILKMERGRRIAGVVVNAVNNQPVAQAIVGVGGGEGSGGERERVTAVSDAQGRFAIEAAPTAAGELEVSVPGFETLRMPTPRANADALRIVLSPLLADGEVRIVLTWERQPPDLDAHLYGRLMNGDRFHVSFDERTAEGATLDVDAKKGLGPETITIRTQPGKYSYLVAHNDSLGAKQGDRLAQSNAQVRVYFKGTGSGRAFSLPAQVAGPAWHVLDVVAGDDGRIEVKPVHRFHQDLPEE